ncbi:MAG TPA: DUF5996 family protein [Candidatus Saccharimonadales bacterium]|nr:DUF5996 family protein [Candidatus Saccharimonadales bacterium]
MTGAVWPPLPYDEWRATRDTLHMYTQVIGKLRLALSPFEPEWANVPLYLTARGLTTSPMPIGHRTLDAEFDLIDHALVLRSSDGAIERRPLGGTVADLYSEVTRALKRLQVHVTLSVLPSEVPAPIPFPEDTTHATYVAAHAARFFTVLTQVGIVLKQHRAGFRGRTTPVHFFWGTFDIAVVRYSGRPAAPQGRGVIERLGSDAEEICAGWWPGDARVPFPAFYAYAYPKPEGIEHARIEPDGATWSPGAGEFILPYDTARTLNDPDAAILRFLRSTYDVAAARMGWEPDLTEVATPRSHGAVASSGQEMQHE